MKTIKAVLKAWLISTAAFFIFIVVFSKLLPPIYTSGGEYSGALPLFLGVALWCIVFASTYPYFKKQPTQGNR